MSKLNKSVVALTFKFDCDRFLRFRLATTAEAKATPPVPDPASERRKRPGIQLVTSQGRLWEAVCYDDISDLCRGRVAARLSDEIDEELQRKVYLPLNGLYEQFTREPIPEYIIEGAFTIPGSVSPALAKEISSGRLEKAEARPDMIWVRPMGPGVTLVDTSKTPDRVLHVIDIKLAAEPSLRHFVEVTFYALALQAWLEDHGLASKYGVSAEAMVWPGTHTVTAFRDLVRNEAATGAVDPVASALLATTRPVPFEIYEPRLREFLRERLPRVLALGPWQASWHVTSKCQLCDFFSYCRDQATSASADHLSQLPDLTSGQAAILNDCGISKFGDLATELQQNGSKWQNAKLQSHRLRSLERAFLARAKAMNEKKLVPISGRKTTAMPRYNHMSIFLTCHFDPGTGITFAMGARKVYFRKAGEKPEVDELTVLVDSVGEGLSPRSERERLVEICRRVQTWIQELHETNLLFNDDFDKHSLQFYIWDMLEGRHFARVLARHAEHETVTDIAKFLIRIFPLEGELQAAEDFRSQPLTHVKPVVEALVGLPVPFGYTLWDARHWLSPFEKDGKHIYVRPPYGFHTDLSDQIPFERAYELWHDKIFLRKLSLTEGFNKGELLTRDELRDQLRKVTSMHLSALNDVVVALQRDYRDSLLLRKEPFTLRPLVELRLPSASAQMLVFQRLNSIADEIENAAVLALPIEERESNFHSIRGVVPCGNDPRASQLLAEVTAEPRYMTRIKRGFDQALAVSFSPASRDTRIREGDFTVIMRPESLNDAVDSKWYHALGYKRYQDAEDAGHIAPESMRYFSLRELLRVTVARLDTAHTPPLAVIVFSREKQKFLSDKGLRTLRDLMVIDPVSADFTSDIIERAIRKVGGKKSKV